MYALSGFLNILAAVSLAWWSFGAINNILLLIPAAVFLIVGCLCIVKAAKQKSKHK